MPGDASDTFARWCPGETATRRNEIALPSLALRTVTEDTLTTFKLDKYDWRTEFPDERIFGGLAPEGMSEYVGNRDRWFPLTHAGTLQLRRMASSSTRGRLIGSPSPAFPAGE